MSFRGGAWAQYRNVFRGHLGSSQSSPPSLGDSGFQQQAAALRAKSGPSMAASLQKRDAIVELGKTQEESYKDDTLII